MRRSSGRATAATLLALAGLHVAWGRGSTFPFRDTDRLEDAVLGGSEVPAPLTCYAVAGLLVGAAVVVADVPVVPARFRRLGRLGVAGVLGTRGVLGLTGRTELIAPHATERFRRLDAMLYSPLCLALASGSLSAGLAHLGRPTPPWASLPADGNRSADAEPPEDGAEDIVAVSGGHLLHGLWRPAAKVAGTLLVTLADR